eukprot:4113569-Amphidinium_carterae.2
MLSLNWVPLMQSAGASKLNSFPHSEDPWHKYNPQFQARMFGHSATSHQLVANIAGPPHGKYPWSDQPHAKLLRESKGTPIEVHYALRASII